MSILNLYAKRNYKMGPLKRLKWWIRREKFKWQRALWGFSAYDTWEMDHYLAELIGDMLWYKAKFDLSYANGMTPEEWQQWLIDTGACFKEYGRELPCPAYEAYVKATTRTKNEDGSITVEAPEDLLQAWCEEERANHEYRMSKLREGFERLMDNYCELWD